MSRKMKTLQKIVTVLGLISFGIIIWQQTAGINQSDLVRLIAAAVIGSIILLIYLILEQPRH